MRELKEKIEKGVFVTTCDLCQAILTDGIENVRFNMPFQVTFNDTKDIVYKIEERFDREVKQDDKIILVPVEKNEEVASYVDFNTYDFLFLIKKKVM